MVERKLLAAGRPAGAGFFYFSLRDDVTQGSPALAGIDLSTRSAFSITYGWPRAHGDSPAKAAAKAKLQRVAPHTWGEPLLPLAQQPIENER
jgi:hypothetical protein